MPVILSVLLAATAIPKAAEIEFDACPQVNVSYSLSDGEGKDVCHSVYGWYRTHPGVRLKSYARKLDALHPIQCGHRVC